MESMKRIAVVVSCMLLGCMVSVAQEAKADFLVYEEENEGRKSVKNDYSLSFTYRIEAGYAQDWQNSRNDSYADLYLHGGRIGATVDFNLPYHFSIQTGLLYQLTYGNNPQHWRSVNNENPREEALNHRIMKHTLTVPVYATYTQKLWRDLALWFYTGPQFSVGVAQYDNLQTDVSAQTLEWLDKNGIRTAPADRYAAGELARFNIQYGLGGGIQWDAYRLLSGYSFGLNNLVKRKGACADSHLWEWGWFVSFSYAF